MADERPTPPAREIPRTPRTVRCQMLDTRGPFEYRPRDEYLGLCPLRRDLVQCAGGDDDRPAVPRHSVRRS